MFLFSRTVLVALRLALGRPQTAVDRFDYVITVCDHANETCPVFPNRTERVPWSFPDPAAAPGSEEQRLTAFRQVRDGLKSTLGEFARSHAW